MACGGFTCSKNALAALNVLYIMVAFILIGVAGYAKWVGIFTDIKIMGGIIACGVFLLLIAIVGLVGAVKHHQVLLFFYMIILFLLFLMQFSIACACLAMNDDQRESIASKGWALADIGMRNTTQNKFDCCGFDEETQGVNMTAGHENMYHPACGIVSASPCCKDSEAACCTGEPGQGNQTVSCPCSTCMDKIREPMEQAVKVAGGIGLFFSFTEIIGVWLALRYRNLKDPRANPSAFL